MEKASCHENGFAAGLAGLISRAAIISKWLEA